MRFIQLVALACAFLCINAATNLVKNPGFDEDHDGCNSAPSWSQYNASNLFSVCPQTDYYMVSKPNGMYFNGLSGWAGAVQTIELNQATATSFYFSCMYHSQSFFYTTI